MRLGWAQAQISKVAALQFFCIYTCNKTVASVTGHVKAFCIPPPHACKEDQIGVVGAGRERQAKKCSERLRMM